MLNNICNSNVTANVFLLLWNVRMSSKILRNFYARQIFLTFDDMKKLPKVGMR